MLDAETIQTLKRGNVSINSELTKQRTQELLQAAHGTAKKDIDALSGLSRISLNRVPATGSISARMAIAIAQTLNINPFYLTGEADEPGECTAKALHSFLKKKGYPKLANQAAKPTRKSNGKADTNADTDNPDNPEDENSAQNEPDEETDNLSRSTEITEEEALQLLRSLFIQAKYSNRAIDTLERMKDLLV